ncbi:hypothetical protein C8R43DRAFT_1119244 [Mycena crocata]|nr:hypothetical protein C8R43DRAFT_1119244 [Mycena crocata]
MSQPLFIRRYIKPFLPALPSSSIFPKKSPSSQEYTHSQFTVNMAPTSTLLTFFGRDLGGVGPALDEPTTSPSPMFNPGIHQELFTHILLGLLGLMSIVFICLFVLWRWNWIYPDPFLARSISPPKATEWGIVSTGMHIQSNLAPPAPAYTAAVDNAAQTAEEALFYLTRANTLKNQRRAVAVFAPQRSSSAPYILCPGVARC